MEKDEFMVVAWAESASGPGWSNTPIRAIVQKIGGGEMRQVWIQPDEQTKAMLILYNVNAASTAAMTNEVSRKLGIPVSR